MSSEQWDAFWAGFAMAVGLWLILALIWEVAHG